MNAAIATASDTHAKHADAVAASEAALAAAREELESVVKSNAVLRSRREELRASNARLNEELAAAQREASAHADSVASAEKECAIAREAAAAMTAEIARLKEDIEAARRAAEEERARAAAEEAKVQASIVALESEAAAREGALANSVAEVRADIVRAEAEADALRAKIANRDVLLEEVETMKKKLAASKSLGLHKQLVAHSRAHKAASTELETKMNELSERRAGLAVQLGKLREERDALLKELAMLIGSKQDAAAQLLAAKRDVTFLSLEVETAKAKAARRGSAHTAPSSAGTSPAVPAVRTSAGVVSSSVPSALRTLLMELGPDLDNHSNHAQAGAIASAATAAASGVDVRGATDKAVAGDVSASLELAQRMAAQLRELHAEAAQLQAQYVSVQQHGGRGTSASDADAAGLILPGDADLASAMRLVSQMQASLGIS